MKKFFIVLVGLMVFGVAAQAKPKAAPKPDLPQQQMMVCDGTMGSMCPMMDAMPAMLQVMKLQQKLDEGVSGKEKRGILADKAKLIAELDSAMVRMRNTPMPCISQPMQGLPSRTLPPCVPAPKK